jgi:signal transduction histidine kinase
LDLISLAKDFSYLSFYHSPQVDKQTSFFLNWKKGEWTEKKFQEMDWKEGSLYFLTKSDFRFVPNVLERFENIFFCSSEKVSDEYSEHIFSGESFKEYEWEQIFLLFESILEKNNQNKANQDIFFYWEKKFKELKNNQITDPLLIKELRVLDQNLVQMQNFSEIGKTINKFFNDFGLKNQFQFITEQKMDNSIELSEKRSLPFMIENDYFFLTWKKEVNDEKFDQIIIFLYDSIERYLQLLNVSKRQELEGKIWQDAFDSLPYAMAIINNEGDLVLHNGLFAKLNALPNECLQIKNGEKSEYLNRAYRIKRIEIDDWQNKSWLFVFEGENDYYLNGSEVGNSVISTQELGIISSSIAHELNNPLAGILAAINVLELEEWAEDEGQALKEMKASAKRCKDLVEIFLGFSKANTSVVISGQMNEALKKALELLRFRMMESNLRIEIDPNSGTERFFPAVNFSIMTIIFYLILSEILTFLHHSRLIEGGEDLSQIECHYKEGKNEVKIHCAQVENWSQKINESKLIKYLIGVEGLELEIDKTGIALTTWRLRGGDA